MMPSDAHQKNDVFCFPEDVNEYKININLIKKLFTIKEHKYYSMIELRMGCDFIWYFHENKKRIINLDQFDLYCTISNNKYTIKILFNYKKLAKITAYLDNDYKIYFSTTEYIPNTLSYCAYFLVYLHQKISKEKREEISLVYDQLSLLSCTNNK